MLKSSPHIWVKYVGDFFSKSHGFAGLNQIVTVVKMINFNLVCFLKEYSLLISCVMTKNQPEK